MKNIGLILILSSLAGCGGNGVTTTTVAKACGDQAMAKCQKRASCTAAGNASGASVVKEYGDASTCITRETLSCMQALSAKDTGNSPDLVESCLAMIASMSCADFLDGNNTPSCVAKGTLANGAACAFAGQCMSSYCLDESHAGCGTCGAMPAAGADCSMSACARGESCVSQQSTTSPPPMLCVAEGTSGATCSRDAPCAFGFSCVGSTKVKMGTCMTAVAMVGATCDPTQQTSAGCDRAQGLFCNATSKTCTAVSYAGDGQTCGLGSDGNFTDCKAGDCLGYTLGANAQPGTCKAKAADGAACDSVNGPFCQPPAKCVYSSGTAGTCTVPDASKC